MSPSTPPRWHDSRPDFPEGVASDIARGESSPRRDPLVAKPAAPRCVGSDIVSDESFPPEGTQVWERIISPEGTHGWPLRLAAADGATP